MLQPTDAEATLSTSTANGSPAGKIVPLHPEGTPGVAAAEPPLFSVRANPTNSNGAVRFFGWLTSVQLSGAETGGRFALVESRASRGVSLPLHVHHGEDKVIYVMEGALTVYIAGEEVPASAGAAVSLPRGVEHSCVVESEEARVLTFFSPAGIEGMISELAEPAGQNVHDLERLVTVAARYGCDITGPPPGRR